MESAHKAQKFLEAKDYPAAITQFTNALKTSNSPVWLIQRSTAYQRNNQHDLAVLDAENAVLAARERGKRELIATAQYRRAIALHSQGRYGDARLCFIWCNKYNDKEKGLTMWVAKNKKDYDKAGGDEADCNKTTVKEIPEPHTDVKQTEAKAEAKGKGATTAVAGTVSSKQTSDKKEESYASQENIAHKVPSSVPAPVPAVAPTPKEKVRMEWYQSSATVSISIFAKGIPKEEAEVVIEEGSLEVSFPTGSSGAYDFTASPLFSTVDKSKSNFRITPHKLEITLYKASPGLKWSSLEGTEPLESTTKVDSVSKIPDAVLKGTDKPPVYPSSSRTGPKNWDTVVGDEKEEGGEIDDFFKTLYKDADPDTRRAMMKSYQESGGTALSTSWSDVGSRTVEVSPPDGMEAKKWEY